jgi:hypothetical protein
MKMSKSTRLPAKVAASLHHIILYLGDSERNHYAECKLEGDGSHRDHVFAHTQRVAKWFFGTSDEPGNEFFDAVKGLVGSVRGYLDSDTGDDANHIVEMNKSVIGVLSKAHEIPELREWAGREWSRQEYVGYQGHLLGPLKLKL